MYKKIWGLNQLKKMSFPCPPYVVIDITRDKPADVKTYILEKIEYVGIPKLNGDRVGVTIRVSMPYGLNKVARHGGLHITDKEEIVKRVLEKYAQYKPYCKIIIQHTVDARCSGTILKESDHAVVETIFGDAPPLLEGEVSNYERWIFSAGKWEKEKAYQINTKEILILNSKDIQAIGHYIQMLPNSVYLEWSISKNGKLYFYEYYKFRNHQ
jgi:hypothetical protein